MPAPTPYLYFDGVAADALRFYQEVFGGDLELHTFADFGRDDGPGDAIAHGILSGPVDIYGSDVPGAGRPAQIAGMILALPGAAAPGEMHRWVAARSAGGPGGDPPHPRGWAHSAGQL